MLVEHYTEDKDWELKPINITNPWKGDGNFIKPIGGLWCSPVDSKFGWRDWCKCESYDSIDSKHKVILDVDISHFIIIDKQEDTNKLIWHEVIREHYAINFEKMKEKGINGIYLTEEGQYNTRYIYPKGLYGWDCESIVILNESSIISAKLIPKYRGSNNKGELYDRCSSIRSG